MALRKDWGPGFWEKYYHNQETQVISSLELELEGRWLSDTLCRRLGLNLITALDIGSGTGDFSNGMEGQCLVGDRLDPHSSDPGAIKQSAISYPFTGYDLLVCRDVLQYFDDMDYACILNKMNESGAKALYIRVPKLEDPPASAKSDPECIMRSYSTLAKGLFNYTNLGLGIWIKNGTPILLLAGE